MLHIVFKVKDSIVQNTRFKKIYDIFDYIFNSFGCEMISKSCIYSYCTKQYNILKDWSCMNIPAGSERGILHLHSL